MKQISIRPVAVCILFVLALVLLQPPAWFAATNTTYIQTNLVADIPGVAQSTDPNLKNPWGNAFSATGPFWPADTGSNLSTVYSGTGSTVSTTVVSVPGGPTGIIFNSTNDFLISNGRKASFVFSTLNGAIYSWNGGTVAEKSATLANASFTGLALGTNSSGNFLYASNTSGAGSIEVFDKNFAHVTLAGSFQDPSLPAVTPFNQTGGYVPYNIQNINGQLYVEYANFRGGLGAVSIFDTNGNFVKSVIPAGGSQLNQPWGVVIAPAGFGSFANDLLVGNLGDGKINAFDPNTGAFLGTVSGFNGPLVNSGLWSLSVRTGGTFNTNGVYITAGINNQLDGLLALITPVSASNPAITTASALPNGKIGSTYSQTLAATGGAPPYSAWAVTGGSLPPGLSLNSTAGTISGTPTGIGGTFNFMVTVTDSSGATGSSSLQLTIQQATLSAASSRVGSFAQVVSGGGWKTTMTLINLSATTVNAQVNFYADNGSPAAFPMTFPEFSSSSFGTSATLTLNPNSSIVIQSAASTPGISVGWADVFATGPLNGFLTFDVGSTGPALEGSMTLDTRLSTALLLPYDNTAGNQTALAIANQSASAQTITVTLFDQNGNQLVSSPMNLPAFGHTSFFVNSQYSQSANQLGVVQFQGSAGVTGVGLRFTSAGSFTSIPIIR
jgi:uncharacterized protein (TIGR03118 family)